MMLESIPFSVQVGLVVLCVVVLIIFAFVVYSGGLARVPVELAPVEPMVVAFRPFVGSFMQIGHAFQSVSKVLKEELGVEHTRRGVGVFFGQDFFAHGFLL
mmetsp:Transcript_8774/g.20096  ORF Transcript_8774/g.20096 Transcript_8774/m.20096 type:complete len:101 (-) Transcript_8774:419-721(-)